MSIGEVYTEFWLFSVFCSCLLSVIVQVSGIYATKQPFQGYTCSLLRFNYVIAKFEVLLSSSKLIKYPQTNLKTGGRI